MSEKLYWKNLDPARADSAHYSIIGLDGGSVGMAALRAMFPEAKADELNFVLFSTSGIHGTYNTIEEAERHLTAPEDEETCGDVTFVIVHPRLVALRYGNCEPQNADDIAFLKTLRESSYEAVRLIGGAPPETT